MRPPRHWLSIATLAGAFLAAATPGCHQVHKWVFNTGVTHYGERPPDARAAKHGRHDVLDIRTTGNDPPPSATTAVCQTIQCQYQRMRRDRLIRDAEWRRNEESRARVAAMRAEASRSSTVETAVDPRWAGSSPIVVRPRVIRARPGHPARRAPPAAPREPSVQLRR